MSIQKIEQDVQQWLEDVVIGLNLCPFAAKPNRNKQIKIFVSEATTEELLLEDILQELMNLDSKTAEELETTLVAIPNMLQDFMDYNFFLDWVDALIKQQEWEGIYQIATFHPDYCFGGAEPEDDENLKIDILDEGGKYLATAKRLIDAKYRYNRLGAEGADLELMSENDDSNINIKLEDTFVSSEVKYEYKSFKLVKTGEQELDKLIVILKKNKDVGVEVTAHTDSKGGYAYNQRLGQQRADAVLNYLLSKGISKNRIKAKSYGQTKPIAPNKLKDGSDNPTGRAKNRRVEFKTIKLK